MDLRIEERVDSGFRWYRRSVPAEVQEKISSYMKETDLEDLDEFLIEMMAQFWPAPENPGSSMSIERLLEHLCWGLDDAQEHGLWHLTAEGRDDELNGSTTWE